MAVNPLIDVSTDLVDVTGSTTGGYLRQDGTFPLTANWNASAGQTTTPYAIQSRTSLNFLNVVAFGADSTGATDSTAAVNRVIALLNATGGVAYFPTGTYSVIPGSITTISKNGVRLHGDAEFASTISVPASSPGIVFKFSNGATTLYSCGISDFVFTCADTTTQKTMIQVSDVSDFEAKRIFNSDNTWKGNTSIGIDVKGRQTIRIRDCRLSTDQPIQLGPNPNNANISFDLSSIEGNNLVVTAGVTNPSIKILDNTVLSNVLIQNCDADLGAGFIVANNTGPATAWQNIVILNCKSEQSGSATSYSIDLQHSAAQIQGLIVNGFLADPTNNCIRLSNAKWPLFQGITYGNAAGTFLNLAASVTGFAIHNSFYAAGGTITDASTGPACMNLINGAGVPLTSNVALTGGSIRAQGFLAQKEGSSIALANARNDNVAVPANVSWFQGVTGGAGCQISGIANGTDGKQLYILNGTGNNIVFLYQDANSSAANRIFTAGALNKTVPAVGGALLIYSASVGSWCLVSPF